MRAACAVEVKMSADAGTVHLPELYRDIVGERSVNNHTRKTASTLSFGAVAATAPRELCRLVRVRPLGFCGSGAATTGFPAQRRDESESFELRGSGASQDEISLPLNNATAEPVSANPSRLALRARR